MLDKADRRGDPATMTAPDAELLELLVCPQTLTALRYDASTGDLVSDEAGLAYPVRGGIPVLLAEEARPLRAKVSAPAPGDVAERLERDGYAVIPGFIAPEGVARLAELFERHRSPIHSQPFAASMMSADQAYRTAVDRGIKEVFAEPLAAQFEGYRHCFSNFLVKAPTDPREPGLGAVPLHQDNQMVDEATTHTVGVWVPLVDTDETNGCFAVIPGSHRLIPGHRWVYAPFPFPDRTAELRGSLVPLPVKAGDAIAFSQALVHASGPNHSAVPRVVAGALLAPKEAQLLCYYRDPAQPDRLEIYAVDDLFYSRYSYRERPEGVPLVAVVDLEAPRIDPAVLAAISPSVRPRGVARAGS